MRIRISMIARERGLPDSEIAKAMNCGTGGGHLSDAAFSAVIEFTDKHNVSLDWLLFGDLKGLLRTVRAKQQST
jgi:hypothetical protein